MVHMRQYTDVSNVLWVGLERGEARRIDRRQLSSRLHMIRQMVQYSVSGMSRFQGGCSNRDFQGQDSCDSDFRPIA